MSNGIIRPALRDRVWNDPASQSYFGEEMLDNQPPWFIPDDWQDDYDRWMSPDFRRSVFELHADFLETLFDEDGYATLYRALGTGRMEKPPRRGDIVDIGPFFTYSGDADLSDAQISSFTKFDTVFKVRVHASQVDWRDTLTDHLFRHWHEKQIFIKGPVEILSVFPFKELRKRAPAIKFDQWVKRQMRTRR